MRRTTRLAAGTILVLLAVPCMGEGGRRPVLLHMADSPDSLALGGTFSAISAGTVDALSYPGLFGLIDRPGLVLGHSQLFAGAAADTIGVSYPTMDKGTFAAGFYRLASGQAEQRDERMNKTGSFEEQQTLMRLGYGAHVLPRLGLGLNASYLHRTLADSDSVLAGIGAGAHYKGSRLSGGLAFDNVLTTKFGATDDTLSPGVRANAAYALWRNMLMLGLDAELMPSVDLRVGIQYMLADRLSLRLGRNANTNGIGLGLKLGAYRFDYDMGLHELGSTHQLKFGLSFGSSRGERRERFGDEQFTQARMYAGHGQYAAALEATRRSQRAKKLSPEAKAFKKRLETVVDAGIGDLTAGDSAMLRRGVVLYLEDKLEMARSVFLQVQNSQPEDRATRDLLALTMRRDEKSAAPSFIDVDPVKLKLFKTEEYFQKHQWDLALKECKEIIAISPGEVVAYVRMGSVYYALGLREEAARAWEFAAALDMNHIEVRKALGFMRAEGIKRVVKITDNDIRAGGSK